MPKSLDFKKIIFPILKKKIAGKRLIYLDSASTTLKPIGVIEAERKYETEYSANVHRGIYYISEKASKKYESTRDKVRAFLNADKRTEIIFTSGTTSGLNLLAYSYGRTFLKKGDEIWISSFEHHSNIIPWQIVCSEIGCKLRIIPVDFDNKKKIPFGKQAKLLSVTYASNAIGIINPIQSWIEQAKEKGITVIVDAAQAVPHLEIDVQKINCDFLVFSGHKIYGPTGIGVLYGKEQFLEKMIPYQTGGDMIKEVDFKKTTYADLPAKFEAGTPNITGVIGLGAAIDFLVKERFQYSNFNENIIFLKTKEALAKIGAKIAGKEFGGDRVPIVSFTFNNAHPHDIATILDKEGIAVRAGHLCAQPLLKLLNISALTRVSLGIYNTNDDIDCLIDGIKFVKKVLKC